MPDVVTDAFTGRARTERAPLDADEAAGDVIGLAVLAGKVVDASEWVPPNGGTVPNDAGLAPNLEPRTAAAVAVGRVLAEAPRKCSAPSAIDHDDVAADHEQTATTRAHAMGRPPSRRSQSEIDIDSIGHVPRGKKRAIHKQRIGQAEPARSLKSLQPA